MKSDTFYEQILKWEEFDFNNFWEEVTAEQIKKVIAKNRLDITDFLILLSPQAQEYLEKIAQKAHALTVQHFGKTLLLYTPMYLANYCVNQCVYCGFNNVNKIRRKQLDFAEVQKEAEIIATTGLKHILLLTGENRVKSSPDYLKKSIEIVKKYFTSVSLEVYPLSLSEYKEMQQAGVDGLTLYQETYDRDIYDQLHLKGPKKDYLNRLNAPERGCQAGLRSVNIGALLGLAPWRKEAFYTGLHAYYLQNKYLETEISLSLPRICPHEGGFQSQFLVNDRDLVQTMLAFRLFLPRAGLAISTRESAQLRDNLMPLGITKISAASSTAVGGHSQGEEEAQFVISDPRDVEEMVLSIKKAGYQPVFQDWQSI